MRNQNNKLRKQAYHLLSLVAISFCAIVEANAQIPGSYFSFLSNQSLTTLPSPNATDLGRFGNIPVSHYTGRADISIPLYSLTQRGVTLDISLHYDTSGLPVNQLTGCVGQGWTLNAGGCITRVVRNSMDEFKTEVFTEQVISYFQSCTAMPSEGHESPSVLCGINCVRDFEPDIFYFSFMGKSGYFLLGNDGHWKVFSDSNLTVAFDAVNTIGQIDSDTVNYALPFVTNFYGRAEYRMSKTIRQLTLLDDDGTRYVFGGSTDAIEYSTDLFLTGTSCLSMPWNATSWFLTEVTDRNGKTLFRFDYARDYFMAQLNSLDYNEMYNGVNVSNFSVHKDLLSGTLNAPVYLRSIQVADGNQISFSYEDAFDGEQVSKHIYPSMYKTDGTPSGRLESAYLLSNPDDDIKFFYLQDTLDARIRACQAPTCSSRIDDPLSSIGMRVLDHISLSSGKNYRFVYDRTGRLHLSDVIINGSTEVHNGKYHFEYMDYQKVPSDYLTRDYDHWGYYKKLHTNPNTSTFKPPLPPDEFPEADEDSTENIITFHDYDSLRNCDPITSQYGMMNAIFYPTGGCTRIEYEQNSYSKRISDNHNSIQTVIGTAGGLRIKSLTEYDDADSDIPLERRTYTYTMPELNVSSGTLYARPVYVHNWKTSTTDGRLIRISTGKSVPVRPLTGSHGPHLGYSYVKETRLDGSYTLYHYSCYEDALDSRFTYTLCDTIASPYDRYTERNYKRGRLLYAKTYNPDGLLMSSVENTYRQDGMEDNYVYASNMAFNQCGQSGDDQYYTGGTYKIFYPKYNLVRRDFSTRHGDMMLQETELYDYQYCDALPYKYQGKNYRANLALVSSATRTRDGEQVSETYTIPPSHVYLSDGYFIPYKSVEKRVNGNFQNRRVIDYALFNGVLQPQYEIENRYSSTAADTIVHYLSYTPNGRLREYVVKGEEKTVLIWDESDRLVAKVQGNINPDSLEFVLETVFPSAPFAGQDSILINIPIARNKELYYKGANIFEQANVSADVYTYDSQGNLTSIKSRNGIRENYQYDLSNRLIKRQDANKNTLERFQYNYSTRKLPPVLP